MEEKKKGKPEGTFEGGFKGGCNGSFKGKFRLLANLAPAALVVALVAGTLPQTVPMLEEIPPMLSIQAQAAQTEAETETAEAVQAQGDFEDGVYQGSATGYGGKITVDVTVENRSITKIDIISAPGETASFMKRAMAVVDAILLNQSWEVDVVSGATYSSKGIMGAVQNALTGETVENETAPVVETEPLKEEVFEEPEGYQDGTYTASARGFGGQITVKVVISDGEIADIQIVNAAAETPSYMTSAKKVISRILSAQSPNVDTVSGATYSSNGIINAVRKALRQAAGSGDAEDIEEETLEKPQNHGGKPSKKPVVDNTPMQEDGYLDGTYSGTAEGFGGDITVEVKVEGGKIASITIVSAEDETPSFMERAAAVIDRIVAAQSLSVDVVSGATYSSVGIINATGEALKQAVKEDEAGTESSKPESSEDGAQNGSSESSEGGTQNGSSENTGEESSSESEGEKTGYQDGIYAAEALCSDEDMFTYTIRTELTVSEGVITAVDVTKLNDLSEDPDANDSYLDYAVNGRSRGGVWYEGVVKQILDDQNADTIDAVSRATYSSNAIVKAAQMALMEAAEESGDEESTEESEAETEESAKESEAETEESAKESEAETEESTEASEAETEESTEASETETEESAKESETETEESVVFLALWKLFQKL